MIRLTKLNEEPFVLNSNLIECIEFIPESKVTLTNGRFYIVKESEQEITQKIFEYNQKLYNIPKIRNTGKPE